METEHMSLDLRLAAIVTLLSSSALHGATPGKTAALRAHLQAVRDAGELDPRLRDALEHTLATWRDVSCHASDGCHHSLLMTPSGHGLH